MRSLTFSQWRDLILLLIYTPKCIKHDVTNVNVTKEASVVCGTSSKILGFSLQIDHRQSNDTISRPT